MTLTNGMPTLSAGQGKAELTNPFSQCLAKPQIFTGLATSSPWKVSTASKHHLKETYLPSHLSGSKRNDFCCFKVKRGTTFVLATIIRSISWEKRQKEPYLTTMPSNVAVFMFQTSCTWKNEHYLQNATYTYFQALSQKVNYEHFKIIMDIELSHFSLIA